VELPGSSPAIVVDCFGTRFELQADRVRCEKEGCRWRHSPGKEVETGKAGSKVSHSAPGLVFDHFDKLIGGIMSRLPRVLFLVFLMFPGDYFSRFLCAGEIIEG